MVNHIMATDPASVPTCAADNSVGVTTVDGYRICAGTPGNHRSSGPIPNNEDVETRTYVNFYNSIAATPQNPCIVQFVPNGVSDPRNVVPFATAHGACVMPSDFPDPKPAPNDRITRLTPFTTASAVGANDDGNLLNGVPGDLLGMTKVWGVNPKIDGAWTHGGVHADNVGAWWHDLDGKPFVVKYKGQTWTQDAMLWCRMTGDKYDKSKDPYGDIYPAPAGLYVAIKADTDAMPNECKGDNPSFASGQVFPNPSASCKNPFSQKCFQGSLTESILRNPSKTVLGFSTDPEKGRLSAYQYTDPRARVGGCFSTRDMYGPGKFSVLINLPPCAIPTASDPLVQEGYPRVDPYTGKYPVADGAYGGRGYVFSIWTFAYAEAYRPLDGGVGNMQMPPKSASDVKSETVQVRDPATGKITTAAVTVPWVKGAFSGSEDDGYYIQHNDEIDIEIPANTGQVVDAGGELKYLGLDTANFNTWLTDTDVDSYAAGTDTLYQQAQATAPAGQFFASVGPGETDEDFHEFAYVWYVDPDDEKLPPSADTTPKSYVAFYRDGVELFKCYRFVPRRSGRVVIGLWPAWWGPAKKPMTYNHVYAKIARLEFVPQADYSNTPFPRGALVTNAAQVYDELTPAGDIKCGIETDMKQRLPCTAKGSCLTHGSGSGSGSGSDSKSPSSASPTRAPTAEGKKKLSTGEIIAIVLGSIGGVALIAVLVMYIMYVKRKSMTRVV